MARKTFYLPNKSDGHQAASFSIGPSSRYVLKNRLEDRELEHLASLNEQLKNRETKASSAAAFEWSYIEKVWDLRRKMTSKIARDKALKDHRRALHIREYQLTENKRQYELKLQSKVNKRLYSRLNHQPDLPPPTMDTVSVEKVPGPAWVKTKQQSSEELVKPGWSRYLDENIKCKFEYLANETNKHKIKFEPEQSFVFDLLESRCGIWTRRLAFLGKEDLYITPCGHLHCADCIFRSTVEQPECPDCGTPFELEQLRTLFNNSN